MALYLFIDKMNTETILIQMNLPRKEFRLYEVIGVENVSKKIQVKLIQELLYVGLIKNFLKNEMRSPLSNGEMLYIKSGGFICKKPILKLHDQTLKRKKISRTQLIFS